MMEQMIYISWMLREVGTESAQRVVVQDSMHPSGVQIPSKELVGRFVGTHY